MDIVTGLKNIKTNVRELEGAIISLIAQSSFNAKFNASHLEMHCPF